jgi:hypothetical protein
MRGVTERAPEGTREVGLAALHERGEIRNQHASGNVVSI